MKRWLRRLLKALTVGAALIVAVLCVCLEGVDHRPYFRAPYYESTRARLDAALTNEAVVFGPLRAGFGKAVLTPTLNAAQDNPEQGQFRSVPLAGYGDRDGDTDVDATDKGTPGTTCTGTVSGACRILDLDFDGGERTPEPFLTPRLSWPAC